MDVERGNTKHGPRLDEEFAREVEGEVRGNPPSGRAQEWREPEPPAEGEPEATEVPEGHYGTDTGDDRDPDYRDQRARVGQYLPRHVFPADRSNLIEAARRNEAPDDVIQTLNELSPETEYANAQELWQALQLPSGPRF